MSTTGNMGRQAPDGHRWVLRPTSEVEPGRLWTVLLPGEQRTGCRDTAAHRQCLWCARVEWTEAS